MGALIAIFVLAAVAAAGTSKSAEKKPTEPKPTEPKPVSSSWMSDDEPEPEGKSVEAAPDTAPKLVNKPKTFEDLGAIGDVATIKPGVFPSKGWPGVRSLPDAWRESAFKLIGNLGYNAAMGKIPIEYSVSASSDQLFNFWMDLNGAVKAGAVGGLGVRTDLALDEIRTAAKTLQKYGK